MSFVMNRNISTQPKYETMITSSLSGGSLIRSERRWGRIEEERTQEHMEAILYLELLRMLVSKKLVLLLVRHIRPFPGCFQQVAGLGSQQHVGKVLRAEVIYTLLLVRVVPSGMIGILMSVA